MRSPARLLALVLIPAALACSSGGGAAPAPFPGLYQAANPWTTPVATAPLDPSSTAMMTALEAAGGWGFGAFRIDYSISVLHAGAGTPRARFVKAPGYFTPDCDDVADFPLPAGGAAEGNAGYACDRAHEDCHVLVVDETRNELWEAYNATVDGGGALTGLCVVKWDLARAWGPSLRGEQCTSADAAGLPIAPLLFTADEIAAGEIPHAIRFILPNPRIRAGVYVHPATHGGAPSGGANLPPYGTRLRLKASYDLATLPTPGARVLGAALKKYGMILSDGGNIALTAADDRFTAHKWADVGFPDSRPLAALQPSDFEVVDPGGAAIDLTFDCVRVP